MLSAIPEQYGGGGGDFGRSIAVIEELMRMLATGPGFPLHSDIVAPYILAYGTEAQKERWMSPMACGETIGAIAMAEPGIGSDLKSVRTSVRRELRPGDRGVQDLMLHKALIAIGGVPVGSTTQQFAAIVSAEQRWAQVIRTANIKAD